jgi:two-component system response regulator HydG
VAEAIVRASERASRPFLRFNCAALPDELAEAELFGHTRGAFTGAQRARNGLFREASGGTLLLDEVGELTLGTQAKLLRVLQEGEVRPVGDDRSYPVDVRILAATHRDLPRLVAEGRFREDLYYRLKVVELTVPPLRERPEDIPVLTRHFLQRYAERFGVGTLRAPPDLVARLTARPWPGTSASSRTHRGAGRAERRRRARPVPAVTGRGRGGGQPRRQRAHRRHRAA